MKIMPRKNNPLLTIEYTVKGEGRDDWGYYSTEEKYKAIKVKLKKGDKLVVKAYDAARNKLIQKYTYTKK